MSRILFDLFDSPPPDAVVAAANAYARMMAALLPPGRVWRLIGDSFLSKVLAACADELGRLEDRAGNLLDESDPMTINELLPEQEQELDLESDGTLEERRARIIGRLVARQRFRATDFQIALAPILGQLPEDVVVIERSHAFAASTGDDREIYRFFIYRDPMLPGAYFLASAQELVDTIKPSHTAGYVIESIDFLCDDPFSLCDRDLLGA